MPPDRSHPDGFLGGERQIRTFPRTKQLREPPKSDKVCHDRFNVAVQQGFWVVQVPSCQC